MWCGGVLLLPPKGRSQGFGLGGRLELVLLPQPRDEYLIRADGRSPVAERHDRLLAQRRAQHVSRLIQRPARARLVQFGPEQREQLVTTMGATGRGGSKIDEQRRTPCLAREACYVISIRRGQAQRAENPKLDHDGTLEDARH